VSLAPGTLLLVVAYCPTVFTTGGAIVQINPKTGGWTILTTFTWPNAISDGGCGSSAIDTPSYVLDRYNAIMYFDFIDELGILVELDLTSGNIDTVTPSDESFNGYVNMGLTAETTVSGLSNTVTVDGWCATGCYIFSSMDALSGELNYGQTIPYAVTMDDTHLFDSSSNSYYIQASYPLENSAECAGAGQSDLCLVSLDLNGNILSSQFTNWTVYKWSDKVDANGYRLAWLDGFAELCNDEYNDFLFAKVNVNTATAKPIACIPSNALVHEEEWIADFSADGSLFATGSGNGDSGEAQILVLNPTNGSVVVNGPLTGLGEALDPDESYYWVWAIGFI